LLLVLTVLICLSLTVDIALAGSGNPVYVFSGEATHDGKLIITLKWTKGKPPKEETKEASVEVGVKNGESAKDVAKKVTDALNADEKIKADWTFTQGSKLLGTYQYSAGSPKGENIKATKVSIENVGVTGLAMSAGIDPFIGSVRFDIPGGPSSGEIILGANGTVVSTTTAGKSIVTIKNELIDRFNVAELPAYSESGTGFIRLDRVELDPFPDPTEQLKGGAVFYTSDSQLGGIAEAWVPIPPVGGIVVPVDKLALLAPYIAYASAILVATAATAIYVKRVNRRQKKQ